MKSSANLLIYKY